MWKYFEPFAILVWFSVVIAIDTVVYYSSGQRPSLVPALVCGVTTLIVGIVTVLAVYEIYKHRNDKEPW